MSDCPLLVTFASWEERFLEGFKRDIDAWRPANAMMYYLDEFAEMSKANREKVAEVCNTRNIELTPRLLRVKEPAENWKKLRDNMTAEAGAGLNVVVDCSTMPREFIWTIFWLLDLVKARTQYVYHRAVDYGEWLSRDPQRPRLVYKLSGIAKLSARTVLAVVAGYDVDRIQQLVRFYEPEHTIIARQMHDPAGAASGRLEKIKQRFEAASNVQWLEVDAFGPDHGQAVIVEQVKPYLDSHNIIMSSLGPKVSAVALYRIQRDHRQVGLAYAPSRDFNKEYSSGIGDAIKGTL
jgi:hypothetical protein